RRGPFDLFFRGIILPPVEQKSWFRTSPLAEDQSRRRFCADLVDFPLQLTLAVIQLRNLTIPFRNKVIQQQLNLLSRPLVRIEGQNLQNLWLTPLGFDLL